MELLNQKFRDLTVRITGGERVHVAIVGLGSERQGSVGGQVSQTACADRLDAPGAVWQVRQQPFLEAGSPAR